MSAVPQAKEFPRYTCAQYKDWSQKDNKRYELIHGIPYAMSAPNLRHQVILMELVTMFKNHLKDKPCKVYAAPVDVRTFGSCMIGNLLYRRIYIRPHVRLFYKEDESDDTVVQPDMVVVCDEEKRGYEGIRSAPNLVVEILSPSNSAIEMERKFQLYRMAGVKEYWIIDPENNLLRLYIFKEDGTIFTEEVYSGRQSVSVAALPGLTISLEQVFAAE